MFMKSGSKTRRLFPAVVTVLAISLVTTTAQAAGKGKGKGKGPNNTGAITVEVNPMTCEVYVDSEKDISNVVRDGKKVEYIYENGIAMPIGNTYILGDYSDLKDVENDVVYVKAGNNGGKRGIGAPYDIEFDDLQSCEEPTCPIVVASVLPDDPSDYVPDRDGFTYNFDDQGSCSRTIEPDVEEFALYVYGVIDCPNANGICEGTEYEDYTGAIVFTDRVIELDDGRFGTCYDIGLPGVLFACPDIIDGSMTSEEASACASILNCTNFDESSNMSTEEVNF